MFSCGTLDKNIHMPSSPFGGIAMLRRSVSAFVAAAVLMLGALALAGSAEAKTNCPKSGPSAGHGNQYPPGQCKAKTDKTTVTQGESMTVSGDGYDSGEPVQAEMHSVTIQLGSLVATAKGLVSSTVTIPANAPLGDHTISLYGTTSGRYLTAAIKVVPAGLPRSDGTGTGTGATGSGSGTIGGLPRTGVIIGSLALAALAAIGLGTGFVVAGRRRREALAA